ncbi:MAG: acyltransferase [Bacteroides sp.]|nr:acyltransferase [Bacteroides sp.]
MKTAIHDNQREFCKIGNTVDMSGTTYLKFIAYMQVICIILVVFGHSFHQYPDGEQGHSLLVYDMMYSFRMPTFIFVSGFLMAYTSILKPVHKVPTLGKFMVSKLRRLLIPYLTLTLVTFVPRAVMSGYADDNVNLSLRQFFNSFFMPEDLVIPYFWFIQASFILLIFSYVMFSLTRWSGHGHTSYILLMAVLFVILPLTELSDIKFFSLNAALRLAIFFLAGIVYALFMKRIDGIIPWSSYLTFISFVIAWAVTYFLTRDTDLLPVCQFCGICMIISIAKIMESHHITWLDHLTGSNYIIFLLSWYFNVFSQQIMSRIVSLPWWAYTLMSLIAGVYGPYMFYRYMKMNREKKIVRAISFLLGQNLKR